MGISFPGDPETGPTKDGNNLRETAEQKEGK